MSILNVILEHSKDQNNYLDPLESNYKKVFEKIYAMELILKVK
jgi:hypothetical protein